MAEIKKDIEEIEKLRGIAQVVTAQEILEGEQAIVEIAEKNKEKTNNIDSLDEPEL